MARTRCVAVAVIVTAAAAEWVGLTGIPVASAAGPLAVSAASGPVGTIVTISGHAGPGCVPGKTWFGFNFLRDNSPSGPVLEMTPPVGANGDWSASFQIPSFIPGAARRGPERRPPRGNTSSPRPPLPTTPGRSAPRPSP